MQTISVPVSEIVAYLEDTLDSWPVGHGVPDKGSERNTIILNAAVVFIRSYIRLSIRHIRTKPDPLVAIIRTLGYPVHGVSRDEVDKLCAKVDGHYLAMTLAIDQMVTTAVDLIGNREVFFSQPGDGENLIIQVGTDVRVAHYQKLLNKVVTLEAPTAIRELDDLEGYAEYIEHHLSQTFKGITNSEVRDEVKRIIFAAVIRQ